MIPSAYAERNKVMDQQEQLIHEIKTVLSRAELVIDVEGGDANSEWLLNGKQVGLALGIPAKCQNRPYSVDSRTRCVHFSFGDERSLLSREMFIYTLSNDYPLYSATDAVEKWINIQEIFAQKALFIGHCTVARGEWHVGKRRWMIGPKERRPGC